MVWELEGYDTEMREARCREYTTSKRTAELWAQIPRIDFTDSGHGIVFDATEHRGKRRPTIRRMEHADKWLRQLRRVGPACTRPSPAEATTTNPGTAGAPKKEQFHG